MIQKSLDWLLEKAKVKKKPVDPDAPRYGDMLDRVAAAVIDLGILFLFFNRLFFWMGNQLYRYVNHGMIQQAQDAQTISESVRLIWEAGGITMWLLNVSLQFMLLGLFVVGAQVAWNTTPGKWLLGLKIVRRHSFAPVENWRYAVRFLSYVFFPGILFAHFNKERRAFHDMIAGTVVLQTRPEGWYWQQVKRGFRWLKAKYFSKPEA